METVPIPEKSFEKEAEEKFSAKKNLNWGIQKFLEKSDNPGRFLSREEEDALQKRTTYEPKALEEWKEHKYKSKYRRNAFMVFLTPALEFLESNEAENIPEEERKNLLERVNKAMENSLAVKDQPLTKTNINEVENIIADIQKYV